MLTVDTEKPWSRSGFKHPDLLRWGMANRSSLIHAALTVIMNWTAAGMPKGRETLGSFESWAEVVGGVVATAGVEGFLQNRDFLLAKDEEAMRCVGAGPDLVDAPQESQDLDRSAFRHHRFDS